MNILVLTTDELWVVATACVCAAACAIPGTFLMFKRAALLGDAISHAILPGLAGAFLLTGSRDPFAMMIGALFAGIIASLLSSALASRPLIKADSALGMVFTSLFALGVLLITLAARNVDLDPGCVLYGLIELTPFDTITLLGVTIPRSFALLSLMLLVNIALTWLFFKEITLSIFDPGLATTLGFAPQRIYYGIVIMTTLTVIPAFEAVGSILVIAMLIIPGAVAYLLADRLSLVLFLSIIVAVLTALTGFWGAFMLNTSVAGMMSVAGGAIFTLAFIAAPQHGLLSKALRRLSLRVRIIQDDILGMLFRWHEVVGKQHSNPLNAQNIYRALGRTSLVRFALRSLLRRGYLVTSRDGSLKLSERGIIEAGALVRSHRLWEAYLAKHLGLPLDHLHEPSERTEHFIGRALAREIEEDVGISKDPHGRSIP